jgi:hypothetical protein
MLQDMLGPVTGSSRPGCVIKVHQDRLSEDSAPRSATVTAYVNMIDVSPYELTLNSEKRTVKLLASVR